MRQRLKKSILILLNLAAAVYLVMAMTSFNHPKDTYPVCTKVAINIEDESTNGFLSVKEVKRILEKKGLYPLRKRMAEVNPRDVEDLLKVSPFVNTAECFKSKDGCVNINLTQRLPIIRIKNSRGEDYYLDDKGGIMPNSKYISDLIIATGNISRWFAKNYLVHLAGSLMSDDFWRNQIVQVNVLADKSVELVPRVGDHIVCIGALPEAKQPSLRRETVNAFMSKKLERLAKFYRYGLSKAGWNKYSYIDIEFDNQIICKKRYGIDEN